MNSAKIIEVIQTITLEGKGTLEDPCREVTRYWTKEGKLLSVLYDGYEDAMKNERS